ncbi:hypothetical protein [Streptomyces sp. NPDC021224]|uniref:hypothetical protein n=1 Tax=unclassified Streptomyces TaxID=2593676 RepID=UPI0037AC4697
MSTTGPASGRLAVHFSLVLRSRDLMLIGQLPCDLDVRDGRAHVWADGREVADLPTGAPSADRRVASLLHVFLMPRGGQRVVGAAAGPDLGLLCSSDPPRATEELNRFPGLRLVAGYRRQTQEILDRIYRVCGALDVPEEQYDPVWSLMREEGFYGLFGRDADLVQALAVAGLASSAGLRGVHDQVFEEIGTTGDAAVASLRRYADRFGMFRLVDRRDEPPGHGPLFCSV